MMRHQKQSCDASSAMHVTNGSQARSADGQAGDLYCWLSDAHGHALAVFAARADTWIELEIGSDHLNLG